MKVLIVSLIFLVAQPSHAAKILIDEKTGRTAARQKIVKTASTGTALRSLRRVGVGMSAMGDLGLFGLNLDINFHPRWSLSAGFGGSTDFSAFAFRYKRILAGESFLAYGLLGFSRWYKTDQSPIRETNPSFLADELMSDADKNKGKIDENLVYPGLGIQYLSLNGPRVGWSTYMEVILLTDLVDFVIAPTLALGSMYYF